MKERIKHTGLMRRLCYFCVATQRYGSFKNRKPGQNIKNYEMEDFKALRLQKNDYFEFKKTKASF